MKTAKQPKEKKRCKYRFCDLVISSGQNGQREFCSGAHKQREYRARKADKAKVTS